MKKIIVFIFLMVCLILTSCEMPENNNNNGNNTKEQDESLNGIDISKYEQPQTDFLKDGHKLNKFEEIAKKLIEEGTFVYQPIIDEIGYEIILDGVKNKDYYSLFYSVNNIKISHIYLEKIQGSYYSTTYQAIRYVKLFNDNDENFSICYKLINTVEPVFYSIYTLKRQNFDLNNNDGVFDLFRIGNRNLRLTEESVKDSSIRECDNYFKIYNEKIGKVNNLELSNLGFNNY